MPSILLHVYRHPPNSAPRGVAALAKGHYQPRSTFTGMLTREQHHNLCVRQHMVQSGDVLRVPEGPLFNQFEVHNHAGDTLSVKGVVSLAALVLSMDLGYVRRFPSATFREERLASQATVTLQQEQTLEQLLNWHCIDVDRVFDNSIEAIAIQRGERRPMPQGVKGWATDINRRDIPLMVRGVVMNGNSRSSPILPLDQVVFPAGTVLPLLQLALLLAQICNQCPDRVVTDPRVVASLAELPNQTVSNTTLLGSDQDPGAVYARRADAVYQIGLRETLVETFASDQTRTVMPVVLFRDLSVFYDWESRPTAETIADHAPFTGAWHPLPSLQRGRGRGAGRGAGRGGRGAGRGRGRGRGAGRAATNSRHHPHGLRHLKEVLVVHRCKADRRRRTNTRVILRRRSTDSAHTCSLWPLAAAVAAYLPLAARPPLVFIGIRSRYWLRLVLLQPAPFTSHPQLPLVAMVCRPPQLSLTVVPLPMMTS